MAPTPAASERITRRVFSLINELITELRAEDDLEGLDALPPVLLTSGVIALSQGLTPDIVAQILDTLKIRVEQGDFVGMHIHTEN